MNPVRLVANTPCISPDCIAGADCTDPKHRPTDPPKAKRAAPMTPRDSLARACFLALIAGESSMPSQAPDTNNTILGALADIAFRAADAFERERAKRNGGAS